MSDVMHLESPHLIVSIYSDQPEVETFARMCDVVRRFDCAPSNMVDVAPLDRDFELLSDLGGAREVVSPNPAQYAQLVAGKEPKSRALRVGFSHRKFGRVIVEYLQKTGPGRHPIGFSVSAEAFGIPETLWSASQRRSAYTIADWSKAVLESATLGCDALYGGIGVEFSLPTPWQIRERKPRFATEIFISRRLIDRSISLEGSLRQAFSGGEVTDWDCGLFFSGWAPYNSQRSADVDPVAVSRTTARALKAALS